MLPVSLVVQETQTKVIIIVSLIVRLEDVLIPVTAEALPTVS